jgi:hypothetical protein
MDDERDNDEGEELEDFPEAVHPEHLVQSISKYGLVPNG